MATPAVLTEYLMTARRAVQQVNAIIDPRIEISRVQWAINEIAAKIVPSEATDAALREALASLAKFGRVLNSTQALTGGLTEEKAALLERLDDLERALEGARPNEVTESIGMGW